MCYKSIMSLKIIILLFILIPLSSTAQGLKNKNIDPGSYFKNIELSEFTTDGCSMFPDGTDESPTLWQKCCVRHDAKYWLGGTREERQQADQDLASCVGEVYSPLMGAIMYLGTRVGGTSYGETSYRWGYGWNYIRGYDPISTEEMTKATDLYGQNLKNLFSDLENNKIKIKEIKDTSEYKFRPVLEYSICEEQIFKYLSDNLLSSVQIQKVRTYQDSYNFVYKIKLNACERSLEFFFNKGTSEQSCNHTYEHLNKLERVYISKSCDTHFK